MIEKMSLEQFQQIKSQLSQLIQQYDDYYEAHENDENYDDELLEQEKNIFGFYLSHHPTTNYYRDNKECIRLNDIKNYFMKQIHILVWRLDWVLLSLLLLHHF